MEFKRQHGLKRTHDPPSGEVSEPSQTDALQASTSPLAVNFQDKQAAFGCRLLSIPQVTKITGLGRTGVYEQLASSLRSVRVGRRRLIPVEALEEWLAKLPQAKAN